MKKKLFGLLVLVSVIVISIRLGLEFMPKLLDNEDKAGLKITSTPEASVFLNGQEVGKTPYQDEGLTSNSYDLKLQVENGSWQGSVQLTRGTVAVINREIAQTAASSSGEILTLGEGKGIFITSTPTSATVEIDDKNYGLTPVLIKDIPSGEHTLMISAPGYLKRSIRAYLPPNLVLNLDVDLAITELNLGSQISLPEVSSDQGIVKNTPTGFLRVREKPSVNGKEVGRASPGDKVTILEELTSWYKIRTSDGVEGYVSGVYIQKSP